MTYALERADGQALDFPARAKVRATETMRLEDRAWKLAARWGFEVDPTAAPR